MQRNTVIALFFAAMCVLGLVSLMLGGPRLCIAIVMFTGAMGKLWFALGDLVSKKNRASDDIEKKQKKQNGSGIITIGSLVLGWLATLTVYFSLNLVSNTLISKNIYYYLGQDSYEHNAFPILWDLAQDVFAGLMGGYVTACFLRPFSLLRVFVGAAFFESIVLLLNHNVLQEDPIWYSLLSIALFLVFWSIGGLTYRFQKQQFNKGSYLKGAKPQNLAPAFIYFTLITIALFIIDVPVQMLMKISPSAAMVQQLEKLAMDGNIVAETELGDVYYSGKSKDLTKAANFFYQAAQKGDSYSQVMLGRMFLNGEGVRQNYLAAYEWLALSNNNKTADEIELAKSKLSIEDITIADKWIAQSKTVLK